MIQNLTYKNFATAARRRACALLCAYLCDLCVKKYIIPMQPDLILFIVPPNIFEIKVDQFQSQIAMSGEIQFVYIQIEHHLAH